MPTLLKYYKISYFFWFENPKSGQFLSTQAIKLDFTVNLNTYFAYKELIPAEVMNHVVIFWFIFRLY